MAGSNILIIDDYPQLVDFLEERLVAEGYHVTAASSGAHGLEIIGQGFAGVCLLDVRLPDIGGLDLFEEIKTLNPNIPVIFITAHATVDMAVEATRRGAFDFIAKGSDLLKRLNVSVKNAFELASMSEQLKTLKGQLSERGGFGRILTVSPKMNAILKTLDSVVNSGVTVLVEGDSGTGKELIARSIHESGSRKNGPFIAVNCAGIPETLLESEMFGYEKGAFTGANTRKQGRFEAADKGTLFLDEVGELPRSLQAKLLRVLQDHSFERVGGNETITVDVRIISATNRNLKEEVTAGNFREDLFYRLSVFPVRLPPLAARPEDIPILAQFFLQRYAKEEGKNLSGFDPTAMALLKGHPFPGNVRELENLVRHAVILAHDREITADDVRTTMGSHGVGGESSKPALDTEPGGLDDRLATLFPDADSLPTMRELQAAYLMHALSLAKGNVSRAARSLSVGRATMYRWMKGDIADD
ncbi:MAG: sigma-54-dependent Fis family transcriptional regulator [Deltaproteobacteria bacterium]|nr:sigma-54-dependent Fis family transcriptional regulator [Deltaproteobacteria bacterium]